MSPVFITIMVLNCAIWFGCGWTWRAFCERARKPKPLRESCGWLDQ